MPNCEAQALRTGELITAATGVNKTIGQQALEELYLEERIMRKMSQDRGRPFYYWKPEQAQNESSFDSVAYRKVVATETNNLISSF